MGASSSRPDGLAQPIDVLTAEWPRVAFRPAERQAEYADAVCRANCADEAWSEGQLAAVRAMFPLAPPSNTTGVGNLAYMSLHGPPRHRGEWENVRLAYSAVVQRRARLSDEDRAALALAQ